MSQYPKRGFYPNRPAWRRALAAYRKEIKHTSKNPTPKSNGSRADWRAGMRHVHSQVKPRLSIKRTRMKEKYRKWRKKHDLKLYDWHYPFTKPKHG